MANTKVNPGALNAGAGCVRMIPTHEAVAAFVRAMAKAGVRPVNCIASELASGELIRFRAEGDKPGSKSGWARLFLDGVPNGSYGDWRTSSRSERWRADAPAIRLTQGERERIAATRAADEAARARGKAREEANASKLSIALWEAATPDCGAHPYLVGKRLPGVGLRVKGGDLVVPLRDGVGTLWNVQRIRPDGAKRFYVGGRVNGLGWRCGERGSVLAIGEGMATMAAVHAATGLPVIAAMTAGNLAAVARDARRAKSDATLILCADDDAGRVPNVGMDAANAAARACGGLVARPPQPPGWPEGKGWDFADTWAAPDGATLIRAALTLNDGGAA